MPKLPGNKAKHYSKDKPWEDLGRTYRRIRVIEEQEGGCLWCGLYEWRGQLIVLQLDHIDGDHSNDERRNLRALCPNCHSQTETYMFKGRSHTEETKEKQRVAILGLASDAAGFPKPS